MNQPINPFYLSKPRDQLLDVAARLLAGLAANPGWHLPIAASIEDAIDIAEALIEKVDEVFEEDERQGPIKKGAAVWGEERQPQHKEES